MSGTEDSEIRAVERDIHGVNLEVDGLSKGGVVGDYEGAEEPGSDDVVVEDWGANLLSICFSGTHAGREQSVLHLCRMGFWAGTYRGVSMTVTPAITCVGFLLMFWGRTWWNPSVELACRITSTWRIQGRVRVSLMVEEATAAFLWSMLENFLN